MGKKIYFKSFLSCLYNGVNYTGLTIGPKTLLLKNSNGVEKVTIDKIVSIRRENKLCFSDIIISTDFKEYKLINILFFKSKSIEDILKFCANFESLEKEFVLFDSITSGTSYVPYSVNQKVLKLIRKSGLFKGTKLSLDDKKKEKCIKYLKLYKEYINNPEMVRKINNDNFLEYELERYKDFFDKIEANPLTKMQRVSIIVNEDNNLIVAGAGSGKTSVIVGKVLYLLKKRLAKPNEILVLAFNKKAQEEIEARLSEKLKFVPDVKTFHALGNHILRQGKNQKSLSKIATDDFAFKNTIKTIIKNNLKTSEFSDIMQTYFQEFFYPMPNIAQFKTEGEYFDYLENFEIRTLNSERVRSLEECYIANFLYLNGIKYEYEKTYPYDCGTIDYGLYKPDFYLTDYDIYIEHFAINRFGRTPDFIDCKKYTEGINWKRKTHNFYKTNLIETYSFENYEGVLLKNLKNKLLKYGVKFKPLDKEEIFKKLNNAKHVDAFTELSSTFLNHFKSNQFNLETLFDIVILKMNEYAGNKEIFGVLQEKRKQAFLNIFKTVFLEYEKTLKQNNENDFNDMILLATKFIEIGFFKPDYKYILVDEFQDISKGRALLLKALAKNKNVKLFCVGDDWQSIYRFAGSDISIMTNFEKEFGYTKRIDLDMTFRFDNQINDVATKFIKRNKNQLKKTINTVKNSDTPSVFIYYKGREENDSIKNVLQEIVIDSASSGKNKVLILSRFNRLKDKDKILRTEFKDKLENYKKEFQTLEIEFSSIHSSKGLGFDYVIVIDMNKGAFPLEKIDDPILDLVLPLPEKFPNAEERRLFYVALTRAKEKVFLICDTKPSRFIEELENSEYNIGTYGSAEMTRKMKCPKCTTGILIKSNSKKSFICSHTNYCNFITPVCSSCGKGYIKFDSMENEFKCTNPRCHETRIKCPVCDGYLVEREGKYGKFYGCSNYPNCEYTKNISKKSKKTKTGF